ncbi:MAG TPA: hypothetical protein VFZ23_05140 [Pyrinomonadaceae bacterium]
MSTDAKLSFLLICSYILCACQSSSDVRKQTGEATHKYDTASIVADLLSKANRHDSYAQDYVIQGHVIKRMYFQFKKNGRDYYSYRSDYNNNGVKLVRLFNVEGKYDYEYYPETKTAIRRPKKGEWDENNYADAKKWHFNFDGYEVVGERQVNGKDCYVLESNDSVITVWKENGLQTSLSSKGAERPPLEYDNFEFDLSEDIFTIPNETQIRE